VRHFRCRLSIAPVRYLGCGSNIIIDIVSKNDIILTDKGAVASIRKWLESNGVKP
jgi:hypothetical protein